MQNPRPNSTRLTPRARQMRKAPSDAERYLWNALRARQLDGLKFRRQLPVAHFIADFACEACKLIVEVDGNQHDSAVDYDAHRTKVLNDLGWRVIRFHAGDVVRNIDQTLDSILAEARDTSP